MGLTHGRKRLHLNSYRKAFASLLVGLAVALGGLAGCSTDVSSNTKTLTGVVVTVEQRSLLEIEWVEIQDTQGQLWRFQASGTLSHFTPSHLREHSLSAERVIVTYHEEDGLLLIDDMVDAG